SGQVIAVMERVTAQALQPGFGFEWTNTAAEEKTAGGAAPIVFGLGFVMVFLVLAAQYESYIDPTIIMLTVPLAILGALGAIWLRATFLQGPQSIFPILDNNIYVQVGLVMLIGMASKNAILIVEFANQARDLGMNITKAAIYAAEERFRPILMTALATVFGFLPLLVASGAGSMSRWSLGTAVFGGMIISTVLSLLLVPNLYIVIKNFEKYVLLGEKEPRNPSGGNEQNGTGKSQELGNKSRESGVGGGDD
ncbi:MAG: hydrophobe/amphiphile efflux-1 family RND transporter, partial [Cyanobacteria bacterium J149]